MIFTTERQDAGMGEHDYAVFKNGVFYARTDDEKTAHEIICDYMQVHHSDACNRRNDGKNPERRRIYMISAHDKTTIEESRTMSVYSPRYRDFENQEAQTRSTAKGPDSKKRATWERVK